MSSWSIDAPGVVGVLGLVETSATELSTALDGMVSAHEVLVIGSGVLASVPNEILALIESEKSRLDNIGNRISACTLGASTATAAYVQGDETMAANTQAAAIAAAGSGDLSFFGGA